MPGSNSRALEKARSLPADALIFDLEDAVAPDAKERARSQVVDALDEGGYGNREIAVRVNGLWTPWGRDDLLAAAASDADAVLLPKVEGAGLIKESIQLLESAGAPDNMDVWCMVETPAGVLHAGDIARAHPRMAVLVMGTSDLAKELGARHTPDRVGMLPSLGLSILAARAYGLAILDGVYLDLVDEEGFADACKQGRDMGFDGKTLIHPRQVEVANRIFGPGEAEIENARRIIEAHAAAMREGKGVVVIDGKLIENLHVSEAHRVLAFADAVSGISDARE